METPDEIIERQGQKIVKQAEQIQRMEASILRLSGNLAEACTALLEIARWNGDCIDHKDTVGSPNPKEIAQAVIDSRDKGGECACMAGCERCQEKS